MGKKILLDPEEMEIVDKIDEAQSIFQEDDKKKYAKYAAYTKSLHEKKATTIRFSVTDLAAIKAKAKEIGIGYQNLIQALVHNYVEGKIKLDL